VPMKYNRRPYDFAFPSTVVAASSTASPSIQLPGDYDFEWWDTVASRTSPALLVLLEINDIRFMNSLQPGNANGIPIDNWAGTAQLPYARRFPARLTKRDQATVYLLDQSGAPNTVSIVLRGFQLIPVTEKGTKSAGTQSQVPGA